MNARDDAILKELQAIKIWLKDINADVQIIKNKLYELSPDPPLAKGPTRIKKL